MINKFLESIDVTPLHQEFGIKEKSRCLRNTAVWKQEIINSVMGNHCDEAWMPWGFLWILYSVLFLPVVPAKDQAVITSSSIYFYFPFNPNTSRQPYHQKPSPALLPPFFPQEWISLAGILTVTSQLDFCQRPGVSSVSCQHSNHSEAVKTWVKSSHITQRPPSVSSEPSKWPSRVSNPAYAPNPITCCSFFTCSPCFSHTDPCVIPGTQKARSCLRSRDPGAPHA